MSRPPRSPRLSGKNSRFSKGASDFGERAGRRDSGRGRDGSGQRNTARSQREDRPSRGAPAPAGRDRARRGDMGPLPHLTLDLYGMHAVAGALQNPDRQVSAIYATEEQADDVLTLVEQARASGLRRPDVHVAPRAAFDAVLPRDAVHQGVGIACSALPEHDLDDLIRAGEDLLARQGRSVLVMLDQVTDPHNMGAIIRSSSVFGATGLIVQRRHAPDPGPVMAKSACGALDLLPLAYETNLSRALETLKDAGYTAIGLDERGAIELPDLAPPDRCVLVLGAEGPGLRRLVREACDPLVRLPTPGPMSSLNVSNAAAVALYQLAPRQR